MGAVGVVLAAIALLNPVYRGLSSLHKGYKLAETFEKDLRSSVCSLETQAWIFAHCIDVYIDRFRAHGRDALHPFAQPVIMQHIANKIEGIVLVANECQETTNGYMTANPQILSLQYQLASPPTPPEEGTGEGEMQQPGPSTTATSSTTSSRSSRLHKLSGVAKKFFGRSTIEGTGTIQESVLDANVSSLTPPPSPWADDVLASYRWDYKQPVERTRFTMPFRTVRWIDHGKSEVDEKLAQLRTMKEDLRLMLNLVQHLEDPFLKLRGSTDKPTLWRDTVSLRVELESLHTAIRSINHDASEPCVPLLVKVEDDNDELRAMMLTRRTCHTKPRWSGLFSLAERNDNEPSDRIILTTPVWDTPSEEIDHLAQARRRCKETVEHGPRLIGVATRGTTQYSHFHLQDLQSPEHIGGHSAAELVQDGSFSERQRVHLASRVALAFVHFNKIHPYRTHGPLGNYKLFGQKERELAQPH